MAIRGWQKTRFRTRHKGMVSVHRPSPMAPSITLCINTPPRYTRPWGVTTTSDRPRVDPNQPRRQASTVSPGRVEEGAPQNRPTVDPSDRQEASTMSEHGRQQEARICFQEAGGLEFETLSQEEPDLENKEPITRGVNVHMMSTLFLTSAQRLRLANSVLLRQTQHKTKSHIFRFSC